MTQSDLLNLQAPDRETEKIDLGQAQCLDCGSNVVCQVLYPIAWCAGRRRDATAIEQDDFTAFRQTVSEQGRAVGIDRVLSEADAAKASLYQHFGSKDQLVASYLERKTKDARASIEAYLAGHRAADVKTAPAVIETRFRVPNPQASGSDHGRRQSTERRECRTDAARCFAA
jgi:AcrR family transcriptional regulator